MKKLGTHFSFFLFLAVFFTTEFTFAQTKGVEEDWKQLYADQGILVEFRKGRCEIPSEGIDLEAVYLKFTNTTQSILSVDWQYDLTYGTKCYNCDGNTPEMSQTIKLNPLGSLEGECNISNPFHLRLFSKFLNMENSSVLEDFHVKGIVVREIKE